MNKQLVILCGGRGSRLMPITKDIPKPMALVNGVPFIVYLIEQAKRQGIKRFLLLTGYLGEKIEDCLGDGKNLGVEIEIDYGRPELDTAERLRKAAARLEEEFYLLYGDNYVEIDIRESHQMVNRTGADLCTVIQPKKPGNISVNGDMGIYRENRDENLNWVEVGYMYAKKSPMIEIMEKADMKSLKEYLIYASEKGGVSVVKGKGYYQSISDIERLDKTNKYFARKRILLIDRDGTINVRPNKGCYVGSWKEFKFIENTVEAMQCLAEKGYKFIVISNQAGIGRGIIQKESGGNKLEHDSN